METKIFTPDDLEKAAEVLQKGEIIAFPTETVYGLGAIFDHEDAVQSIFQAKGRPSDNPLILHIANPDWVHFLAEDIPQVATLLMAAFFPGPLTLILPKKNTVNPYVTAGLDSVAFRMPSHKIALSLIEKTGKPLAAPSANLSGKPSSTQASHVLHDFQGIIAGVVDGGVTSLGIESTVLSLLDPTKPRILRPGAITQEMIEEVISQKVYTLDQESSKHSPGTRYRHYAPSAKIILIKTLQELHEHLQSPHDKAFLVPKGFPITHPNMQEFDEKSLYAFFRDCDTEKIHTIIAFLGEEEKRKTALMNRFLKAMQK